MKLHNAFYVNNIREFSRNLDKEKIEYDGELWKRTSSASYFIVYKNLINGSNMYEFYCNNYIPFSYCKVINYSSNTLNILNYDLYCKENGIDTTLPETFMKTFLEHIISFINEITDSDVVLIRQIGNYYARKFPHIKDDIRQAIAFAIKESSN